MSWHYEALWLKTSPQVTRDQQLSRPFLLLILEVETGMGHTEIDWVTYTMWPSTAVFFNLCFEVEPFAAILTAHRTSCDDLCIGSVKAKQTRP